MTYSTHQIVIPPSNEKNNFVYENDYIFLFNRSFIKMLYFDILLQQIEL